MSRELQFGKRSIQGVTVCAHLIHGPGLCVCRCAGSGEGSRRRGKGKGRRERGRDRDGGTEIGTYRCTGKKGKKDTQTQMQTEEFEREKK